MISAELRAAFQRLYKVNEISKITLPINVNEWCTKVFVDLQGIKVASVNTDLSIQMLNDYKFQIHPGLAAENAAAWAEEEQKQKSLADEAKKLANENFETLKTSGFLEVDEATLITALNEYANEKELYENKQAVFAAQAKVSVHPSLREKNGILWTQTQQMQMMQWQMMQQQAQQAQQQQQQQAAQVYYSNQNNSNSNVHFGYNGYNNNSNNNNNGYGNPSNSNSGYGYRR